MTIASAKFTIKNYRGLPDTSAVTIEIGQGFTAFVGPNNAGKSTILKFIYDLTYLWNGLSTAQFLASSIRSQFSIPLRDVPDPEDLRCDLTNRRCVIEIAFPGKGGRNKLSKIVLTEMEGSPAFAQWQGKVFGGTQEALLANATSDHRYTGANEYGDFTIDLEEYANYFRWLSSCAYIGPFRNAVNEGAQNYRGQPMGTALVGAWDEWKRGAIRVNRQRTVKVTNDLARIFEIPSLDLNASRDGKTMQARIGEQTYRLDDIGSGFAEFFIVLATLAMSSPQVVLIDEPELHLHPSLQLDFLTTVASYAQSGAVLYATHSLGLARAAADRVYSIMRKGETVVVKDFHATSNLAEFMGLMSYAGYVEMGANRIVLVEGPTEVRAVQQLLRKRHAEHSSVVAPLGGASLINGRSEHELTELRRLSPNVFAIIDSERSAEAAKPSSDRTAFLEACERVGIRAMMTNLRAFENYLSDRAVRAVKGAAYRALTPYERLTDVNPAWGKHENWQIVREMQWEEVEKTDIGTFIDGMLKGT